MVKKLFQGSFMRYLVVGVTSAGLEFLLLIVFVERFGLTPLMGNVFAFLITCILNYILSRKWVFERTGERKRVEFILFMVFVTCGLLISQLVMWIGVDQWYIDYRISKVVATGFVVIWNFFTRKYVVFNRSESFKGLFPKR
jgi:putative flippase GtrA